MIAHALGAECLPVDAPPESPPISHARELLTAFAGFAALGLAAGLGSGDTGTSVRTIPSALFVGLGMLTLTGPALLVGHQFFGLRGRVDALVSGLAGGFASAGRLALGLSVPMLFFSATTSLWWAVFLVFSAGIGVVGLAYTIRRLLEVSVDPESLFDPRPLGVVAMWAGLSVLIALRLAWDVGGFAMFGTSR